MTRSLVPPDDADLPRDPAFDALDAYRAAFGETPTVMGIGYARSAALAAVLREAITEGRPLSDVELRRRLGMTMPPPGAQI